MQDFKQVWKEVFLYDSRSYSIWNKYFFDSMGKKSKIAFLHIPKTGGRQVDNIVMAAKELSGSSRKEFFVKYLNRNFDNNQFYSVSYLDDLDDLSKYFDRFSYLSQHFTGRQFQSVSDDFFKISLVRDPYARFRSHFVQHVFSQKIDVNDYKRLNGVAEYLIENYSNIFSKTYSEFCDIELNLEVIVENIYQKFDFVCSISYMDHMISRILNSNHEYHILSKNEHFTNTNNKNFAKRFLNNWIDVFMEKNELDMKVYRRISYIDSKRDGKLKKKIFNQQIIVPPVKYFARPTDIYLKPKVFSSGLNYRDPRAFGSVFDVYRVKR